MKIYVNGDSFTAGDGLADPETFGDIYPGHHTMVDALDREWAAQRSKLVGDDLELRRIYIKNNQKYVWSTVLAELVNATVVTNAIGGSCMMGIATRTIADLELIQSRADLPDYVFIGLTNSDRLGYYHSNDIEKTDQTFNWVKSSIPAWWEKGHADKYAKLFETTWTTLNDEELLINYLKECLQIKNYVKRRIGRDPIFLNTTYLFWQYKEIVNNSKNQWLRMLWFDLLEFDKINDRWFNKGAFEQMTACGHVLPPGHAEYARDLAREHFGWGKSPDDRDAN